MNPMRDSLLGRHAAARPRLDALRDRFVAGLAKASNADAPASRPAMLAELVHEIFGQARLAWAAVGVMACIASAVHLSVDDSRPRRIVARPATPGSLDVRLVQAELLAELFPSRPASTSEAQPDFRRLPPSPAGRNRRSSTDTLRWFA